MNVSPFQIIYGREPNLPIDNLLRTESWKETINTPEEHMEALRKMQRLLFEEVRSVRKERFERNKAAAGANKPVPQYGPYEVLARLYDGLVYKLKHLDLGYISNATVSRMIPVENMVVDPRSATDLPGSWQQFGGEREDRINDQRVAVKAIEGKESQEAESKEQPEEGASVAANTTGSRTSKKEKKSKTRKKAKTQRDKTQKDNTRRSLHSSR
jgi:hypothetical protein